MVAAARIEFVTVAALAPALLCRTSAASPATWGEAIEVPLSVAVAVLEVCQVDLMALPGANKSRQLPKLEYEALASALVVAPTVMAEGSRAGE